MRKSILIKNLSDISCSKQDYDYLRKKINCKSYNCELIKKDFYDPTFLRAFIAILVLNGNSTIIINYKEYTISRNNIILLSALHLFNFKQSSLDFKCEFLFVGEEFINDMDSTDMIYRRIRYGVKMFNKPILLLKDYDAELIYARIKAVDSAICNFNHLYYKDFVLNQLISFYLDLSNIIDSDGIINSNFIDLNRYECIIKDFVDLLVSNYAREHRLNFYAKKLNISSHYLNLIVKRITGQSASDFIYQMLFSKARYLLISSKLSVAEICEILNFSDQSAFGKFFKRKAGVSPANFKKVLVK